MKNIMRVAFVCIWSMGISVMASEARPDDGAMSLWYRQPAEAWLEAMPIGNGYMGAMVFGKIQHERIALNESSFWSGRPHDYDNPEAINYFPRIRDLVFAGEFQTAEKMADAHFFGVPAAQQAFQPLGDLLLDFDGADQAGDYRRDLNLLTGIASVSYRVGTAKIERKVFMSYPDRVMVVHLTSDQPGMISVRARFTSPFLEKTSVVPGKLVADGVWQAPPEKDWLIAPVAGKGLRFQTALLAKSVGGSSETNGDSLQISHADEVTFILTAATSYVNYTNIDGDPSATCRRILKAAARKNFPQLDERHERDFRGLMGRVDLQVGDAAMNDKPTDERLNLMSAGTEDANLEALTFQFGRYLLASSSRAGGQPPNLQGIWNEKVLPPWGSKYTININTEMNYWPAEVCNLSECHQPLFALLKDLSVTGAKTAQVFYGIQDGWVAHHNTDLWRGAAPTDAARFGMWPVGGAWLCQDIWEHYAFTGDRQFLKEYYPIIRGAALFLLELMVEDPKHHWLVTPFSMSPEHGYIDSHGHQAFLSPSPTMDIGIIREIFPHCIAASETLGIDGDFRAELKAALSQIPPYQIGRSGFLQEWIEDWQPADAGHIVSPNFPFYPGNSITLRGNPDLAATYPRWLEAHPPGGGFPLSWDIAMWARLERGDKVGDLIRAYMNRAPAPNLHNSGSNQSDASFGFTAAVAEALVQSHAGEISLLPALPVQWPDGSVKGLCARGGWEVSLTWRNGKLHTAEITGKPGGICAIRYGEKRVTMSLKSGQIVRLNRDLLEVN